MERHEQDFSALHSLLWAKTNPYKQLLPHMIDAGCCAKVLLESGAYSSLLSFLSDQWNCSSEEAIAFTAYLVAIHDIGKASPQFQMQEEGQLQRLRKTGILPLLPEGKLNPVRHEYLSKKIAGRIWKETGERRQVYDGYSCVLSLHHQKPDLSQKNRQAVHDGWKQIQDELEAQLRKTFRFHSSLPVPKEMDPVCILLTGILILCDWVASSESFAVLPEMTDGYYERSIEIARDTMKRYGFVRDHRLYKVDSFCSMWPQIKEPRSIQKACEALSPSAPLTIIEAPMGEGKTEAALYMAARCAGAGDKRGIYVALPTQATSNQMFGRFAGMLQYAGGGNARLLHGTAFLMKEETGTVQSEDATEAEKWLGTARMGLLDENGVGTVDQAMGAVLLARFSVLRLLGLFTKTLIIDELHAYDAYMSEIIESLLRWCCALSIPVVLLSATLQDSQRMRYLSCFAGRAALPALSGSYPLITQVLDDGRIVQTAAEASMRTEYRFETVMLGWDEKQAALFAVDKIRNGGCYCILANTVKRAQGIYRALQEIGEPDTETLLFHARFTLKKREEIEKECLRRFGKGENTSRPKKAVLVATQVVEQSLDIDFDGMLSDLAPIDLLLQRAGRVHRHRDRIRPEGMSDPVIHVMLPERDAEQNPEKRYGLSGYVYAPFLLYNTEKLLKDRSIIRVPQDVRSAIAAVYENVSEENMKIWQEMVFDKQLMAANADKAAFPPPEPDYFFPAQSLPEFEDMNIDDGFDPSMRAATRLGEPTFRISFTDTAVLNAAKDGKLSKADQKKILLSSVSLRLASEIQAGMAASGIYQIRKGVLWGCYVTDQKDEIQIGKKKLMNDPVLGVYWGE